VDVQLIIVPANLATLTVLDHDHLVGTAAEARLDCSPKLRRFRGHRAGTGYDEM
jgi:hypothetical protein